MPALFFTIDFKDFDIGKIDEQLEKQLQKAIGTKSGINVLKHPKVAAALLPALSATTIDHTIKQLNGLVILDFFLQQHLGEHIHIHNIIHGIKNNIPNTITRIKGIILNMSGIISFFSPSGGFTKFKIAGS